MGEVLHVVCCTMVRKMIGASGKQVKTKEKAASLLTRSPPLNIFVLILIFVCVLQVFTLVSFRKEVLDENAILVSYSYFEKDQIQLRNLRFFLAAGCDTAKNGRTIKWTFVVSGADCTPCEDLYPFMSQSTEDLGELGIKQAWEGKAYDLLLRTENVGMDFAAHNVTLEFVKRRDKLKAYRYFIFLNSSVMGPFYPKYMPATWHWTDAYLVHFVGDVHAVSSSLVCLPGDDAGGPGPRIESWAFAVSRRGLDVLLAHKVLWIRTCKLCTGDEGIVVGGEYGLSRSLLEEGLNFATLMSKYWKSVDWRNHTHWQCNDLVHPSRHGSYEGISFHPYETVFVKSSWHVADPYTKRYRKWRLLAAAGIDGTEGHYNETLYRYAISPDAQQDHQVERCYNVLQS